MVQGLKPRDSRIYLNKQESTSSFQEKRTQCPQRLVNKGKGKHRASTFPIIYVFIYILIDIIFLHASKLQCDVFILVYIG